MSPLTLDPDLRDALERPNPLVHLHAEISAPDVQRVLRRPEDQLNPVPLASPLLSLTPASSLQSQADGGVRIVAGGSTLASFSGYVSTFQDIQVQDDASKLKAMAWEVDPSFGSAHLRKFRVKVERTSYGTGATGGFSDLPALARTRLQLQIFQAVVVPGHTTGVLGLDVPTNDVVFRPLLEPAKWLADTDYVDGGSGWAEFDLTSYQLIIDTASAQPSVDGSAGPMPAVYYFVLTALDQHVDDRARWWIDTTTSAAARTVAGVGTFQRRWWSRQAMTTTTGGFTVPVSVEKWVETRFNDVQTCEVEVETYDPPGAPTTVQAVYVIALADETGAARAPLATSTARAVLEAARPQGTSLTAEVSTAGSGGPWTPVVHGDVVTPLQATYHMRVTWTPSASFRATPVLYAVGIEARQLFDVTAESTPALLAREIAPPFLTASIPEGGLRLIRTGQRDYLDTATTLGSLMPATRLEADIYLASPHAAIPRAKWLRLERALVTNRTPTATGEDLPLLSYLARTKKKIPRRVEQAPAGTLHRVIAANVFNVGLNPTDALVGVPYAGKGYYLRVKSTTSNVPVGYVQTITGNVGTDRLAFSSALPGILQPGDVVEVHSGTLTTERVVWTDADPAVVWLDILQNHLAIPLERIGFAGAGSAGRGGLPPTLAMRAPGDTTTQNKLRVTMELDDLVDAADLLDQLSFILGGATTEVAGQIVFVQIYPQLSPALLPVIPLPAISATYDARDYVSLQTPVGLENRGTVVHSTYGVNATVSDASASAAAKQTAAIDVDASAWLTEPVLEDLGTKDLPDDVARWLYNSYDGGLYLASVLTRQVMLATSTGLRVFTATLNRLDPARIPGDVVAFVTDGYTDYNPANGQVIKGWVAVRAVVVAVQHSQTKQTVIRGFVLGLTGNVIQAQGGQEGASAGGGQPIAVPAIVAAAYREGDPSGYTAFILVTPGAVSSPFLDGFIYSLRSRKTGSPTWSPAGRTPILLGTGPHRLEAVFGTEVEITPLTITTSGVESTGTPVVVTVGENPAPEVTLGTPVRGTSSIMWPVNLDADCARAILFFDETSADPGTVSDLTLNGGAPDYEVRRPSDIPVGAFSRNVEWPLLGGSSNWLAVAVRGVDRNLQLGPLATAKAQGDATALVPNAPASAAFGTITSRTVPVAVTMPAAWGAATPTLLRLYEGNILVQEVALTAGLSGTQTITHAALTPSTAHGQYRAALATAAGLESVRTLVTPSSSTTTSAETLAAPVLSGTRGGSHVTLNWTAPVGGPGDETYTLQRDTGSGYTIISDGDGTPSFFDTSPVGTSYRVMASRPPWAASAWSNVVTV